MISLPYHAETEGNPNWPLPPDYPDLPPDEQKAYRLAIMKTQGTPEDFLTAFLFFESYYLVDYSIHDPDLQGMETPFFEDRVENADFHLEGIRDWHRYDFNVLGAPRGGAKSVKFGCELPLFLIVTRSNYHISLCLSTDRMIASRFEKIRRQLEHNERIREDWGNLKPIRGQGLWSHHQITLMNGSWIEGFSVTGRKRGQRPHLFILDDPEYDPEKSTDVAALRDHFATTLFRQIIPMLRPNCKLFWMGTTINRRGLLYHALCDQEDARFASWNRRRLKALEPDPETGEIRLLWAAMWSHAWLQQRKIAIGASAFSAEYLNEPVAEEDRVFHIHPLYDTYEITGALGPSPRDSDAVIRFLKVPVRGTVLDEGNVEPVQMSMRDFMRKMPNVIMCVDYASTVTPTSDFSAIAILGFTPDLNMWLLDFWQHKVSDNTLVNFIWKYGSMWQPRVVATEHQSVLDLTMVRMEDFIRSGKDSGWRPRPFLIKYGGRASPAKGPRIAAEEWRFSRHLIKLPFCRQNEPMWRDFFRQVEDFTPDLNLLEHDDAIDAALGMPRFVVKSGGREIMDTPTETPVDRFKRGETRTPEGFPLILNPDTVAPEVLQAALDLLIGRAYNKTEGRKPLRIRSIHY